MSVSLKECNFEHTELSIHFESLNDECAIVKEAKDANMLCPSKSTTPVLKRVLFQYLQP